MKKKEKIKYAQTIITQLWRIPEDSFLQIENLILETDRTFFEIISFGYNAVIMADEKILDWCVKNFADVPAADILDGEHLFKIESKLREHGKKLSGEHTRYLHLNSEVISQKPELFTFEIYEKERLAELYEDSRFDNALNYEKRGEALAIIARKDREIAAIVGADTYNTGFWQIGIDTMPDYRGYGLAAYLVKEMALEIEKRGHVPFYITWSANLASIRTALAAGFQPVWIGYWAEDL